MRRYNDVVVHNMLRELAPSADIGLLREYKGKRTDPKTATFLINGNFCWTRISELDLLHSQHGHKGVMDDLAGFLRDALGSEVKAGIYDSDALREQKRRRDGKRAGILEFAMKSAGSSDRDIYEALKHA
jgi:hypothetical protein